MKSIALMIIFAVQSSSVYGALKPPRYVPHVGDFVVEKLTTYKGVSFIKTWIEAYDSQTDKFTISATELKSDGTLGPIKELIYTGETIRGSYISDIKKFCKTTNPATPRFLQNITTQAGEFLSCHQFEGVAAAYAEFNWVANVPFGKALSHKGGEIFEISHHNASRRSELVSYGNGH